jgi:hypothetical protein
MEAAWLHTVTTQDLTGSLVATAIFTAVLCAPGYVIGFATGLFGFRRLAFFQKSLWAIAYSLACAPVAAYLVGHFLGLTAVCWLFAALAIAALILLATDATHLRWPPDRKVSLIALGWVIFVLLVLIDLQVGTKLFYSVVLADQSYRVALTDTIVRTGLPPANPLYFAGTAAPLHYYYFWNILCAVVVRLGHVSARSAFMASSIWAGFGLSAVIYLFTRHFFHWSARRIWIAQGLVLITGFDLVPALGNAIVRHTFSGDIAWWAVDPVDSWSDSLLWVPHHVAAALCCVFAWLLLWRTLHTESLRDRIIAILIAAAACASAFGLSVYVAAGFALIVLAWIITFNHPVRHQLGLSIITMGFFAALLSVPFIDELCCGLATSAVARQCHFLSLSVRQTIDSGLLTALPVFASWNQSHPVLLDQGMRLLLLLPGMAMELGLYGVVLVLLLIARRRSVLPADPARDTALFFSVSGLIIVMFIGSSIITNNDFGYRAVLLPQFFLLLLTADLLGSWWTSGATPLIPQTAGRRKLICASLILGLAGTIYGNVLLRVWLPIEAALPHSPFNQLPNDAYQLRTLFTELNARAPLNAVIAFRPIDPIIDRQEVVITPEEFYQRLLVMHTGRQILNAEHDCAVQFGGDPHHCPAIQTATQQLYSLPAPSADDARQFCLKSGTHYLLIGHHDPDWPTPTGWPATLPVIVQQPSFKILDCSSAKTSN